MTTWLPRIFIGSALVAALTLAFPGTRWVQGLGTVWDTLFLPASQVGLGLAAFYAVVGFALSRRKRLAWWLALAMLALVCVVDLIAVTIILVLAHDLRDPSILFILVQNGLNSLVTGAIATAMVLCRAAWPGRTRLANIGRALLVTGIGLLLSAATFCCLLRWRMPDKFWRTYLRFEDVPSWIMRLTTTMVGVSLLLGLWLMLRAHKSHPYQTLSEEVRVRTLLNAHSHDSLGYFATRRDRSVTFSPDGAAAVSFRVQRGVCLASGDPLGPREHWGDAIQAWLDVAHSGGWTPAVLGAGQDAAAAYHDAGFHVLNLGDEAVLETERFRLNSPALEGVRHAVRRLRRHGAEVGVHRLDDLTDADREQVIALADQWREGDDRGFSMALNRRWDSLDGDCVAVIARVPDETGTMQPMGLLVLVPWARDGLSLDVMRRHPRAENGITEFMVAELMRLAPELGVERVSLNFAVMRSALEEGARIDASPFERVWRRVLLLASRWWQIESLYRSNMKYDPLWLPRYLCFADHGDIPGVGLALGAAEGFVHLPLLTPAPAHEPVLEEATVRAILATIAPPAPLLPARRLPEQVRVRMRTRQRLLDEGHDPYPVGFRPTHDCAAGASGDHVVVAGRVRAIRDHGGVCFVDLVDASGRLQLVVERDRVGADDLRRLTATLSLGDLVGASGVLGRSHRGERSLLVEHWQLTSKALRPLPDARAGFSDPEGRVRHRHLDLIMNPGSATVVRQRSLAIGAVRDALRARDFLEVETPMLQTIHGGANARPFRTHINAYDLDLYLRIAPELYLKRLMVGGFPKVFEIGRNFRNEGADATHNPEFTMLEAYEAHGDYTTMRTVVQQLVRDAAIAALGTTVILGRDRSGREHEIDLADEWRVTTVHDGISEALGEQVTPDTPAEHLRGLCDRLDIHHQAVWSRGEVLLELYEHLCEDTTIAPTFYCDFPAEVSPLTRQHRDDPRLAERWDLVCLGMELGTAYSELVDPVVQRQRLTHQSLVAAGHDPEAMQLDEDFLTALEYGMPPSGGLGVGLDRLVMLLTGTTIREAITFPIVKPRA